MTGVAMNPVLKLLADVGTVCAECQRNAMRNLTCKHIQCDEIWQFCYAKAKNVPAEKQGQFGYGDVWTWVALDAETKLIPCWAVGGRDAGTAHAFISDLAGTPCESNPINHRRLQSLSGRRGDRIWFRH